MMNYKKMRDASLKLEKTLHDYAHISVIKDIDVEYLRELIYLAKSGKIKNEYSGPLPWKYGFLEGWYNDYPEFLSAALEFENVITYSESGLKDIEDFQEMIRRMAEGKQD